MRAAPIRPTTGTLLVTVVLSLALPVVASCSSSDGGATPTSADSSIADASADADPSDAGTMKCPCALGLECVGGVCVAPPTPLVENISGSAALAAMEVWTVVWEGDEALGAQSDAFNAALLADPYWTTLLGEYGVGAGTAKGVIVLGAPPAGVADATFYDSAIASLVGKTSTRAETFSAPNANTVISFLLPHATAAFITGSYHEETTKDVGGMRVPYFVMKPIDVSFVSAGDYRTWSQSHELMEIATDPHPDTAPAWTCAAMPVVGEIADLCQDIPVVRMFANTTYMVNRAYSAKRAAARSGDPCVPSLEGTYENIAVTPLEVKIGPEKGAKATVHLTAFSFGAPLRMHWSTYPDPSYALIPAEGEMAPGDDVVVTITRTTEAPPWDLALNVWVTDPSAPHAPIPLQESFAAIVE